jgi:hypothetical protein
MFDNLRRSFRPLFLTIRFYRVIAFTVLTLLVSGLTGSFFARSGRLVIANEDIATFFLQPVGFSALLFIAACSLTLISMFKPKTRVQDYPQGRPPNPEDPIRILKDDHAEEVSLRERKEFPCPTIFVLLTFYLFQLSDFYIPTNCISYGPSFSKWPPFASHIRREINSITPTKIIFS